MYLTLLLKRSLKHKISAIESEIQKKLKDGASFKLADNILKAPDQFIAAVMMKQNKLFFGHGDF
jgi:hypothetical protein